MAHRQVYTVHYIMNAWETERFIDVIAASKEEAYDKATYEAIPEKEGRTPYSSWVTSVTYQNGNCRWFNTCSGLPY